MTFVLSDFRVEAARPSNKRCPRHTAGSLFIRGPLPVSWFAAAYGLPGSCGQVGLALWFLGGMNDSDTVKLTRKTSTMFGLSRWATSRALTAMERAGLIRVERGRGRAPVVTLVVER